MLQTAAIFQDKMILQRNKPVFIWGTGTPGADVSARIQGKEGSSVVGADGQWKLEIPALDASDKETLVIESGSETLTYEDAAVGEVWVAGGQSNMEFWMRYEKHKAEAVKDCPNDRLRFFDVPEVCYEGQLEEFDYSRQGVWREAASKEELEYFSAVGYYFQKEIEKELGVPVGIIGCNWGGTLSRAWMNPDTVRQVGAPWMKDYEDTASAMDMDAYWKKQHGNYMNDRGNPFADAFGEFCLPRTPSMEEIGHFFSNIPEDFQEYLTLMQPQSIPGSLYEHMLKTIAPYSIRGFLWYQGESDDVPGKNVLYKDMLTGLISDWRILWNDMELPFLFVQLPGFRHWLMNTEENHYPVIRKCQEQVADTVNHAYLCSISDAGEEFDIHPKDKKTVGERLAWLAEGHVYGKDILCDAPRAVAAKRNENLVTVTFANAEGGLEIKGEEIEALEVYSGEEALEYAAHVEDNAVVIRLERCVCGAVTVQFAQTPWYLVNLYNRAGIPAVPFEFEC